MLTRRQKELLDFLAEHVKRHGYAPTLAEMADHLRLGSVATVHKHLQQLEDKGMIRRLANRSRALEIVEQAGGGRAVQVPLLGRVAAGTPIEALEVDEAVAIPDDMLGRRETFALRVAGNSMIDDGIHDGDVVVVERRSHANDGATVVAVIAGAATIKRLYRRRGRVHLVAANAGVAPIVVHPDEVEIRGIVIALLRRYR